MNQDSSFQSFSETPGIIINAIVVTRGNSPEYDRCIESLQNQIYPINKIFVVDISSSLGSKYNPFLVPEISQVLDPNNLSSNNFQQNNISPSNVLFVHANNCFSFSDAINLVINSNLFDPECRWVLTLHEDNSFSPNFLSNLVNKITNSQSIVQIGSKQINPENKELLEVGFEVSTDQEFIPITKPIHFEQQTLDLSEDVFGASLNGSLLFVPYLRETQVADSILGQFGDSQNFATKTKFFQKRVIVAPQAEIEHQQLSKNVLNPKTKVWQAETFSKFYHQLLVHTGFINFLILLKLFFFALFGFLFQPQHYFSFWKVWGKLIKNYSTISHNSKQLHRQSQQQFSEIKNLFLSKKVLSGFNKRSNYETTRQKEKDYIPTEVEYQYIQKKNFQNTILAFLLFFIGAVVSLASNWSLFFETLGGKELISPYFRNVALPWGSYLNWLILLFPAFSGVFSFLLTGVFTKKQLLRFFFALFWMFSPLTLELFTKASLINESIYLLFPLFLMCFVKSIGENQRYFDLKSKKSYWSLLVSMIFANLMFYLAPILLPISVVIILFLIAFLSGGRIQSLLLLISTLLGQIPNFLYIFQDYHPKKFLLYAFNYESYTLNSDLSQNFLDFGNKISTSVNGGVILIIILVFLVALILLFSLIGIFASNVGASNVFLLTILLVGLYIFLIKDQLIWQNESTQSYVDLYPLFSIIAYALFILILLGLDRLNNKGWKIVNNLTSIFLGTFALIIFAFSIKSFQQVEIRENTLVDAIGQEQQLHESYNNVLVIESSNQGKDYDYVLLNTPDLYFDTTQPTKYVERFLNGFSEDEGELSQVVVNLISGINSDETIALLEKYQIGGIELPRSQTLQANYTELISSFNQIEGLRQMTGITNFCYWKVDYENI